jgi:hypothetical protein
MTRLLTPPPTSPWTIRPVFTRADVEAVFRLRYRVIVQELGDPAPADADARGMIEDPADATGHTLAAFDAAGRVLAAVRFNVFAEGVYPPCADILATAGATILDPTTTTLTARFVADTTVRSGPLPIRLVSEGYRLFLARGVRRNLIYVRPPLERFYRRLGYQPVGDTVHPKGGPVRVLDFDLTADTPLRRLALREVAA